MFFWSSRQGTFEIVNSHNNYNKVLFKVDSEYLDQPVKVLVGMSDDTGYIDKKYITLEPAVPSETSEVAEISEIALLSEDSSSTSVSLAIGLDMSANMQNFDTTSYKTWMSSVEGLIESAGDNVDLALLTDSYVGYPVDTEAAKTSLEFLKTNEYSGDTDAETMLDRCIASLHDSENMSQYASKVAVVFANKVSDVENLKNKILELEQQGIAVYVMLLGNNDTAAFDGIENIHACDTELRLRLNVSELYNVFSSMAQIMTVNDVISTETSLISDFKKEKHCMKLSNQNIQDELGALFASMLNLYSNLPVYVESNSGSYCLMDNIQNAEDVKDIYIGNAVDIDKDNVSKIASFYSQLLNDNKSSEYIYEGKLSESTIQIVIDSNLKYRFPVLIYNKNDLKESYIITKKETQSGYKLLHYQENTESDFSMVIETVVTETLNNNVYAVFDTYSYLVALSNLPDIQDKQDISQLKEIENFETEVLLGEEEIAATNSPEPFYQSIQFTIPKSIIDTYKANYSDYTTEKIIEMIVKYELLPTPVPESDVSSEATDGYTKEKLEYIGHTVRLSGVETGNEYVFGIKTKYKTLLPDMYNTTKYYNVIKYADESGTKWYYPYLYKGTNIGIINGDEVKIEDTSATLSLTSEPTEEPSATVKPMYFNAQKTVSRAEYIKMLLCAAKIDVEQSDDPYWAAPYLAKAIEYDLIREEMTTEGDFIQAFYNSGISRCEAAYALAQLFIYSKETYNIASVLYEFNDKISYERVSKWYRTQKAYSDQCELSNKINQLYESNLLAISDVNKYYDSIGQIYMNNLMDGNENGEFKADSNLTKAEAAKIIVKSLFTLDEGLENVDTLKAAEKTVHIILYDSVYDGTWATDNQILCAPLSTDEPIEVTPNPDDKFASIPRYMNEDEKRFEYENTNKNDEQTYDIDFFRTYFKLLRNSNATFSISIRDLDFNRAVKSDGAPYNFMTDIPKFPVYKELAVQLGLSEEDVRVKKWNLIAEQTANRIIDISANMKMAYDSLPTNERPMKLPKIFIGTPHLQTDTVSLGEEMPLNEFVDSYTKMAKAIYEKVVNGGIEENRIAGIYFGREDPDNTSNKENDLSWNCKKSMAEYVHSIGKKVIWMPYTCGNPELMKHVAEVVNKGYEDVTGEIQNLCDIVVIQPGFFYYEVTPSSSYLSVMSKYIYPSVVDQVVYTTTGYTDIKLTTTQICFQMEYDLSLITGRYYYGGARSTPYQKAKRLFDTYEIFKNLIYDNFTSFGIYSGGPNEQNYNNIIQMPNSNFKTYTSTFSGINDNFHSHRNHLASDELINNSSGEQNPLEELRQYNQFSINEINNSSTTTFVDKTNNNNDKWVGGMIIAEITDILLNKGLENELESCLEDIYGELTTTTSTINENTNNLE